LAAAAKPREPNTSVEAMAQLQSIGHTWSKSGTPPLVPLIATGWRRANPS
jgi:hypothetical protein